MNEEIIWICPYCEEGFDISDGKVEIKMKFYTTAKCPYCEKWMMEDEVIEIKNGGVKMVDKSQLDLCLRWIESDKIKSWTEDFLKNKTPDYFWEIPASSTGKYHPKYAAEESGLVKHTKVAFHIAMNMLDDEVWSFNELQRDIILSAILLHDTRKLGVPKQEYTVDEHPKLVADAIMEECESGSIRSKIAMAIETHMGQWGEKPPENEMQFFVHLCDYLSSRKYMEVNFDRMKV